MANDNLLHVEVDTKSLHKVFEEFNKNMPNTAQKLIRAVNNEVVKQIKREARSRGYHTTKPMQGKNGTYIAGYSKNIRSYANRDYSGKIMITNNAFYYRFIEFGAVVPTRKIKVKGKTVTLKGFAYPTNPLVFPIANQIWGTEKGSRIMERKFQEIINKEMNKGKK